MITVKDVRHLRCVLQDAEPPESSAILRKGTKVLGPTPRVRFTRTALRHSNIRENEGPSLNEIQVKLSHQRSPYAVKFEDRSQEETERQERYAREDAWRLAKNIYKLKEKDKATFFSPSDEWSLPAASTIKPEEREFVVDSGANMHMVSKKDLASAELDTVKVSQKSDDGGYSRRRGANKRRGNSVRQGIGFIRDSNASRRHTGSALARKTLRRSRV